MRKRKNQRWIALGAAVIVAAGVAGYFVFRPRTEPGVTPGAERTAPARQRPATSTRRLQPSATKVVVAKVELREVVDRVAAVGTGRAIRSLTVSAEVAGVVAEIKFTAGQLVKQGQPLLVLNSEAAEIATRLAQVKVDDAAATVKRYETLVARNAVADVQLEQAKTTLALAKADLEAKQYELRRRSVLAPFDGVMGITTISQGDFLREAAPIATIDDRSTLLVDFQVAERAAAYLKLEQPVRATTPAITGRAFTGKITALDSRIDAASRTLRVEAAFPNADNRLIAGMTFSVSLDLPGERLATLPGIAVQWDRGGAFVWQVTADNTVARVAATIRQRDNDKVSIEADLKDGALVIVEGAQGLIEGSTIQIADNAPAPRR